MNAYLFMTKDALCTDYLPTYGNKIFKTPNIDELAQKGTVFLNHYTCAPSTVMAFWGMITGEWAHDTDIQMYEKKRVKYSRDTIFTKLKNIGLEPHLIWDDEWDVLLEYEDIFGDVELHSIKDIKQAVGSHFIHKGFLKDDEEKTEKALATVERELKDILSKNEDCFIWLHLPHVIAGKTGYGTDIEVFDRFVAMARKYFPDDKIAISADHGNMNGHKGKICYGHDAYNPSIRIPLITPRIDDIAEYKGNTSNVDLIELLTEKKIPARKFVYSDTAYRAQKNRKLAIMSGKYKYIYNKKTKTEELYDLELDLDESFSVMSDYTYDTDRKINAPSRELYFYPEWDKLAEVRSMFRKEKERIWRNGDLSVVLKSNVKDMLRPAYNNLCKKRID